MQTSVRFQRSSIAHAVSIFIGCGALLFAATAGAQTAPNAAATVPATEAVTELSGAILYQTMVAEISAARGDYALAAQAYLDLARRTRDARIARRATEIALIGQQGEIAGQAARLWVSFDPSSTNALQTFAAVLAGGYGKLEDMEPPLMRLLERETMPTEMILLQLPRLYARYPDKTAALASIERLTQGYQEHPEAHYARAIAALAAQENAKAETYAARALQMRPDWEQAAVLRAQAAPKEREAQAMEALNTFGKRYPLAREARLAYAKWLVSERRNKEAAESYNKLLADSPNNDELALNVAVLAVQAEDYASAEKLLRQLIARGFRDPDLLRLQLAQILVHQERSADAITEFKAIRPGPHYASAQAGVAQLLAKGGDLKAARASLKKAAEEHPGQAEELALAESQMLRQLKQDQLAMDVLNDLLTRRPDHPEALYESALLAERLKQVDVMERNLRRLITLNPNHAHAHNALGYSFADRNVRLDEADKLLARALQLSPNDPAILDSVGWLRYRQGDLRGALTYIQQAYGIMPDAEIAAHLGEILWVMGRRDEARKTWEDSRKTNPDSQVLVEVMKRFQ